MYAPKGIAALYVREGVHLEPVIYVGVQERGLRAGTENIAFAAALGAAADLAADDLRSGRDRAIAGLRDRLEELLRQAVPDRVFLNGPRHARLPNTLNISIDGAIGHELLAALPQLAASTGSACHSGLHSPSPVWSAMGVSGDRALAALRLSLGRWTTREAVERAAELIASAAR